MRVDDSRAEANAVANSLASAPDCGTEDTHENAPVVGSKTMPTEAELRKAIAEEIARDPVKFEWFVWTARQLKRMSHCTDSQLRELIAGSYLRHDHAEDLREELATTRLALAWFVNTATTEQLKGFLLWMWQNDDGDIPLPDED